MASIEYRVFRNGVWSGWVNNGGVAGGQDSASHPISAFEIQLVNNALPNLGVSYQGKFKNAVWQGTVSNGQTAGRTDNQISLDMIRVSLINAQDRAVLFYRVLPKDVNVWLGWTSENVDAGRLGKPIQAIQISYQELQ